MFDSIKLLFSKEKKNVSILLWHEKQSVIKLSTAALRSLFDVFSLGAAPEFTALAGLQPALELGQESHSGGILEQHRDLWE